MRTDIPAEAVSINGTFIEDIVSIDYTTIKTEGREVLARTVNTADSAVRDGEIVTNTKFPSRTISVEFFLHSTSLSALRTAINTMNEALNVEDAKIIFNDEDDKYFIGTVVFDEEITDYKNGLGGKYTILCKDPFKYSNTEKTVTMTPGDTEISVTYNGTYKGYPTVITEFPETVDADGDNTDTSECGFVGFVNQRGAILQFGDPNETDWADVTYPATVPVNRSFTATTNWTLNGTDILGSGFTQVGTVGTSSGHVYPTDYDSGTSKHGPSLSYIITGESEPIATNFNFSWVQKFVGTKKQFGAAQVLLYNNDSGTRTLMGGVYINKTTKDTKCKVSLYVGSTTAKTSYSVQCSKIGSCSMKKVGDKITFEVGGKTKAYADSTIESLVANEIVFWFGQNASKTALGSNWIKSCKLQRHEFTNYEDIQNIFSPGDVLTANTDDASVYLDDGEGSVQAQWLGALGNDWEEFYLSPGSNTIGVDYSTFTTTEPTFTIKYRERYL